jgi:hypothetical protein
LREDSLREDTHKLEGIKISPAITIQNEAGQTRAQTQISVGSVLDFGRGMREEGMREERDERGKG